MRRRASRLENGKKCVHTTTIRTDGKINKQKETHPLARAWDEFGVVDAMALNAKFDFWFGLASTNRRRRFIHSSLSDGTPTPSGRVHHPRRRIRHIRTPGTTFRVEMLEIRG